MAQPEEKGFAASGIKWAVLHEVASVVAAIAGIKPVAVAPQIEIFQVTMRGTGKSRRRLVEQGIHDLIAILEPGLAALLSAVANGAEPRNAALALWNEFVAARDALLLIASDDHDGPVHLV